MSTKLLSFRLLDISQRLPGLLISRNYAKPLGAGMSSGDVFSNLMQLTILAPLLKF